MLSFEGIAKNFRFMVVQVRKQIERTHRLLDAPDPRLIEAIQNGDDYIDTQKSMIENECFSFIGFIEHKDEKLVDAVRALNVITNNLERIADLSVNIARQMNYLGDAAILKRFDYNAYFDALREGVDLISDALFERDTSRALRICHAEQRLDKFYCADIGSILSALRSAGEPDRLITVLFILHYLERMGDALLNIGEAILFAVLGERLKIQQYRVLDAAVASTPGLEPSIDEVELQSIWGTRSGVRIGTLEDQSEEGPEKVLFKEGNPRKLDRERHSLDEWGRIAPGVAPKVVEYEQRDSGAALLLQYIDGTTFQELLLNAEPPVVLRAMNRIEQTLRKVWSVTKKDHPVQGHYLQQLRARIDDVRRMHPRLFRDGVRIGSLVVPSFESLLEQAAELDEQLAAPFSVFIHGDFNLDNIIYNREADSLHFVDVHRSRDMDYVQDVSVFLVSSFRRPVFVPAIRLKIESVSRKFLAFVRSFAGEHGDTSFEARLALGLVRSFTTSTRFELNRGFARDMHHRAILLLNRLLAHRGDPWEAFRVPDGILVY